MKKSAAWRPYLRAAAILTEIRERRATYLRVHGWWRGASWTTKRLLRRYRDSRRKYDLVLHASWPTGFEVPKPPRAKQLSCTRLLHHAKAQQPSPPAV